MSQLTQIQPSTKVALITGANKGLGLETARQLGAQGIHVLIGARDTGRGEAAASELRNAGISADFIHIDVTNSSSIKEAVKQVGEAYGKLDILINNAGIGTFRTAASEETLESWRTIFDTNVFGLIDTTQQFLPLVKKSEAGRIVNLSSVLGSITMISDPHSMIGSAGGYGAGYGASKSAVNMFTAHLARELSDTKIKVNAAHPGWVKTDLGGEEAPLDVITGAKTTVELALVPADGPNGGYFHLGKTLPW